MTDIQIDEHWTMNNLIEARQRYQRMLDALGYTSRIDSELRSELIETIEHFDRKIGLRSHAPTGTIPPGSAAAARFRSIAN